jgi:predicted dithiol-disulfide oxidoreductase (DUF899 family)
MTEHKVGTREQWLAAPPKGRSGDPHGWPRRHDEYTSD